MIDLVYKLTQGKTKSPNEDLELRYSLRSVERHLTNVGRIWIVGDMPQFETVDIGHIPHKDTAKSKQGNIFDKIITVCNHPYVSDPFLEMDDDFIFIRDMQADRMPYFADGRITGNPFEQCAGFSRSIRRAGAELVKAGRSTHWTSGHWPMRIDKDNMLNLSLFNEQYRNEPGGINPHALYPNWYGMRITPATDIKAHSEKTMADVLAKADSSPCISLSDRAMQNPDIRHWLNNQFPIKSRWEA